MKKQSPIYVYTAKFNAYTRSEKKRVRKNLCLLNFLEHRNFRYDTTLAGIAAEICFRNKLYSLEPLRGVRHRMTLTLVDTTASCEVASGTVCVNIPKGERSYCCYADFPLAYADLKAGHSYKYVVHDDTASITLGEYVLHLFKEDVPDSFGQPMAQTDCTDGETLPVTDEFDEALDRFLAGLSEETDDDGEAADVDDGNDAADGADGDTEDDDTCGADNVAGDGDNAVEQKTDAGEMRMRSLERLTGLRAVKEKFRTYERVVRFNKMRTDSGLPLSPVPLHAMFLGSPGTGKTTVAKMTGLLLRRAGVLSKGHVVVRERATLLGQNYNSEAEKTLAAIEEAQGGILFIDEAYQLCQPDDARDPGKFVIETLLTALADSDKRDWMLILAGYPDEMKRMFDMNPGFKSRIPASNIYCFEDFTECELMEIAENYLARFHYTMTPDAHAALAGRLGADYAGRDRKFGNARHVINLIETEILPAMAVRVTSEDCLTENSLTEIQVTDIPQPLPRSVASRPRIGFAL
ncbi:MAG: AAA family ATPase [Bacteroidaceae bacterium]|nr:AAA family ATPase [Bacteroidaceae bacterium]